MTFRLMRLRIRTRLYVGFGALILLAIGITGLSLSRLRSVAGQVAVMSAAADNAAQLGQVLISLEQTRTSAGRFYAKDAKSSAQSVRDSLAATTALLRQVQAGSADDQQQILQSVRQEATALGTDFEKLVVLAGESAALHARQLSLGDQLTQAMGHVREQARPSTADVAEAVSAVEQAVYRTRVDILHFVVTGQLAERAPISADRAAIADAVAKLEAVEDAPMQVVTGQLRGTLDRYFAGFEQMSELDAAEKALYFDRIVGHASVMRAAIADLEAALIAYSSQTRQVADATIALSTRLQVIVAAVTLLLGSALALLIGRGIARPLTSMTIAMGGLAEGDTSVDVPARQNPDEIGGMARAVEVFRQGIIRGHALAAERSVRHARDHRRRAVMDEKSETFGTSVSEVMDSLMGFASGMYYAASEMTAASASMHEESSSTSEGARISSENLNKVAEAVDALTLGFEGTAREVAAAAAMSRQAVQRVEASQETIRGLSESTALIGDVVQLIKNIAGQTNLLALNATIEAARAGAAGKGFAVVAGEVKALAGQTAKATADIAAQIDKVRHATEATIGAMTEIGGMIGRMDQAASAVAEAVQEQTSTTHEVAESIKTVSSAIEASARDMAQVIAIADQQAVKASEQLLYGVTDIGQEVEKLKSVVDGFLDEVRNEAAERRQFQRFDGRSDTVSLMFSGEAPVQATIKDMSLGGAALHLETPPDIGTVLLLELPDAAGPVTGTVVRSEGDTISVEFAKDDETRGRVERALQSLTKETASVAA